MTIVFAFFAKKQRRRIFENPPSPKGLLTLNEMDRMKGDFKGFLELKKPFTLLSIIFQAALTTSG